LRPTAPYQTKCEWGYLHSALEVDGDHAAEFACLPHVSLAMSRLFLERVAARDPAAEHVVIWDQAGFHPQTGLHQVPSRIHLLPLPPCSPELNPVEIIGDVIKDRIANTLWQTLEALEEALGEELRSIHESAERVRSLVSHPWLAEQVNATVAVNSAVTK
jgi:transposase